MSLLSIISWKGQEHRQVKYCFESLDWRSTWKWLTGIWQVRRQGAVVEKVKILLDHNLSCYYFVSSPSVWLLVLWEKWKENYDSEPSQKAKTEARAATVHKQLRGPFIGSETPSKTLDPCSSTHITAHHPACCNSDGKNPYYFDWVWQNCSNERVRCTLL